MNSETENQLDLRLWQIAIVVTLLSIVLKILCIDSGLPYNSVSDTQHVMLTIETLAKNGFYEELTSLKTPPKYPILINLIYLSGLNLTDLIYAPQNIIVIRSIHLSFFVLNCVALICLPIPRRIRGFALLFLSLSLNLHHYSVIERIHAPTGALVFLSYCSLLFGKSKNWQHTRYLISSVFAGLSVSMFYTGALAWAGGLVDRLQVWKSGKRRGRTVVTFVIGSLITGSIFVTCYPWVIRQTNNSTNQLNSEYFGHYFGNSQINEYHTWSEVYNLSGFFSYFDSLLGWDPFLWSVYLVSLVWICRNRRQLAQHLYPLLGILIPYQFVMGVLSTNQARRDSFAIPLMSIVAAHGVSHLISKRKRWINLCLILGGVFSLASIIKYTVIANNHTQVSCYEYFKDTIPEGASVILGARTPPIEMVNYPNNGAKSIKTISLENASNLILEPGNPIVQRQLADRFGKLPKYGAAPLDYRTFKFLRADYMIYNTDESSVKESITSQDVRRSIDLILTFPENPVESSRLPRWPDDFSNILIKIWGSSFAGPRLEVYKFPWAKY